MSQYYFYYTDSLQIKHKLCFTPYSHRSVMDFIFDSLYEEWGDCKGRAWCGTCLIKVITSFTIEMEDNEKHKLSQLLNNITNQRLACQLHLNIELHEATIEYLAI